ncbi:MAG: hypothetical protein TREMPRED_005672 [Tremellales sp. Tagirdzhanova-0007]|nr:MAG: hypothetical protein TREMPRED_005672 [Tremellales sp. Tagirdzhanova-0007]
MPPSQFPQGLVHILVNPAAGHGHAPEFVDHHVLPLLRYLEIPFELHETTGVNDAGRIGQLIHTSNPLVNHTVIIAGGDGTAHEMIEGVLADHEHKTRLGRWDLVILPLGTANALFASLFPPPEQSIHAIPSNIIDFLTSQFTPSDVIYKLSSLLTSLTSSGVPPRRLPITLTSLSPSQTRPIPSHIVCSTSLHAAILSTSETLRASHPGLERFGLAAKANLGVFFHASVRLIPPPDGRVTQYNPHTQSWVDLAVYDLQGPFTYLLSTTTAPRLEPTFVIAPLLTKYPPLSTDLSMDLVILRPLRDPRVRAESTLAQQEEVWKLRAGEVLGQAYNNGAHVDLTYMKGGGANTEIRGTGEVVVEYFRCAGFDWTPTDAAHEPSHLVCADGSLHTVTQGGTAQVRMMPVGEHEGEEGFHVWG